MSDAATARGRSMLVPRPRQASMLGTGMMIWLASELMFLAALYAAYLTIRAHDNSGVWPPAGDKVDVALIGVLTAVLVASALTMRRGVALHASGRRAAAGWWVAASFVGGLAFVAAQAAEWASAPFSASTNAYGSMFYLITGVDVAHAVIGLVALALLGAAMAGQAGSLSLREHSIFQAIGYYWSFVAGICVVSYILLYLL
jgi:cytochrome c oxidase subunit 3